MDSITSSALEEICFHGKTGLSLASLWSKLNPCLSSSSLDLSLGVKKAVWAALLRVPSLRFRAGNVSYTASDPLIQSLEDAEKLELKIAAEDCLRDNFLGLYNVHAANADIPLNQRRALERIAISRMKGITQWQLSKELGMEANHFAYVVKSLENRGLIVKESAVVRTKDACNAGEMNNSSIVCTNLIHLNRYAKQLGSQQRIETTKEEETSKIFKNTEENIASGDGFDEGYVKEDVLVEDDLPALKAVCDKLEEAYNKVLVVSEIKQDLGYERTSLGHKAWKKIYRKLKDAHIVEKCKAKVNGKVEQCLRLLKKFPPKNFKEQTVKFGRKCQITEQLVETPIDHQMYDMIDIKGSEGLLFKEACKRLRISNKENQSLLSMMAYRFGMHLQAEIYSKTKAYRVWTAINFNSKSSNAFPRKSKTIISESKISNLDIPKSLSTSESDIATPTKMNGREITAKLSCGSNPQQILHEPRDTVPDAVHDSVGMEMETNDPSETAPTDSLKPFKSRSYQRYPCLSLTVDGAQREQRILEQLQNEKFILKAELHRWLISLEKDKCTTIDRKTLHRMLDKLQRQGHCKCIAINVPLVTNSDSNRIAHVVLHPTVTLSPELHEEIYDKLRFFERKNRNQAYSKWKSKSFPELDDIQRNQQFIRFQKGLKANRDECASNFQKKKKSLEAGLVECTRVDDEIGQLGSQRQPDDQHLSVASRGEHGVHLQSHKEDDYLENMEGPGPYEEDEKYNSFTNHCTFSEKLQFRRRFHWTEEADRKLIIQYVKQRVVLGPNFQHACWASLSDLPKPPSSCLKRMTSLNKNEAFQRALMRLCNIVGGWYVKHLEKVKNKSLDDNGHQPLTQSSSRESLEGNCYNGFAHTQKTGFEEERQDDFTEEHIKRAFDEVLRCKHIATFEARKIATSVFKGADRNMDSERFSGGKASQHSKNQIPEGTGDRATKFSNWLHERGKYLMGGIGLTADLQCGDIFHLFALVSSGELSIYPFLPENGIGEADDLRSKKQRIDNNECFDGNKVNKTQFLDEVKEGELSISPCLLNKCCVTVDNKPIDGDKAEKLKLTDEEGGELSCPCSPDEVDVEGKDLRKMKRKIDNNEFFHVIVGKKLKSMKGGYYEFRREKGFPSIMLYVHSAPILRTNVVEVGSFENGDSCNDELLADRSDKLNTTRGQKLGSNSKYCLTSMAGLHQDPEPPLLTKSPGRYDDTNLILQPKHHGNFDSDSRRGLTMDVITVHDKVVLPGGDNAGEIDFFSSELSMPVLPWKNGDETMNGIIYKGFISFVLRTVMQNPGILEDDIIHHMDGLNPQSCRKVLELMTLDKHLIVKKMFQTSSTGPPAILGTLIGSRFRKSKLICRKHFFANPLSTTLL